MASGAGYGYFVETPCGAEVRILMGRVRQFPGQVLPVVKEKGYFAPNNCGVANPAEVRS
jgi:hypothetical protein